VHLAAMVHSMNATDPALAPHYHRCNVDGTLSLARQAATAGVSGFVFLSSVKAVAESSPYGAPLRESIIPYPPSHCDPYGMSKYAAEQGLLAQSPDSMNVTCLRPPLVYGPGVTANFLRLMGWVQRGRLLPLGGIKNQRSLLYVGNLVAAIEAALDKAPVGSFFVADDEPLSTSGIIQAIAKALDKPAKLVYFPSRILFLLAKCLGKQAAVDRLLGSLALDSSEFRRVTGWQPTYSVEQGMAATAQWFLSCNTTADKQ
jgi:nucleoside-diphosphate-sugar epimerase